MVEKYRIDFFQKTVLVIFGIFLSLVFMEIGLRIASGIFSLHLGHRNKISLEEKDVYRILCLGESTTVLGLGGQSYPSQLQNVLNQQNLGIKFRVINGGVIGVNTTDILRNLENNLDRYKPNLVITMMGVNDEDSCVFEEVSVSISKLISRFSYLKVYKLIRLLWARSAAKIFSWEETILDERLYFPKNKEFLIKKNIAAPKDYKTCLYLARMHRSEGNFSDAKQMYEKTIALNPKKRRIYAELAWLYEDRGLYPKTEELLNKSIEVAPRDYRGYLDLGWFYRAREDFSKAQELLQEAISIFPKEARIYIELGWLYKIQRQYSLAEKSFKKAEELCLKNTDNFGIPYCKNGRHVQMIYGGLATLYSENGQYKKAGYYYDKADELRTKYFNSTTRYNYQMVKKILDSRGIKLLCVQYPMRSVKPLKNIFEWNGEVLFVDNERIFKDKVEKEGYDEYFNDIFAGDFGHCTLKGNRLLAENISKVIISNIFNNITYAHDNSLIHTYLEQRKYKKAIQLLKQNVKAAPEDNNSYLLLGEVYGEQHKYDEALNWLNQGLKINPNNSRFYAVIGRINCRIFRLDEAAKYLNAGLRINPEDTGIHVGFARVCSRMGRYNEALEWLNKAIQINPDDSEIYICFGYVYKNMSNYDEAIKWLNKGLEIYPYESGLYAELGGVYNTMGKFDEALKCLKKGLEVNLNDSKLYVWFGQVYWGMGKYDTSVKWLKKGMKVNPNDSEIYRTLSRVYRAAGKYAVAVKYAKKVIEMKKEGGYDELGRVYTEMGKKEEASELFNKELESGYRYACPYQGLGNVYRKIGLPEEAEKNLLTAVEIDPFNNKGYYDLAEYYYEIGNLGKAADNVEKALTLAFDDYNKSKILGLKGFILIMQDKSGEAKALFDGMLTKYGKNSLILSGLGHIYNARKDFVNAKEYFKEAIRLNPGKIDTSKIMALLGLAWVNANEHKHKEAIEYYEKVLREEPLNILALLGMGNVYNWLGEYGQAEGYFKKVLEIDKNNEYALAGLGTVYLNRGDEGNAQKLLSDALKINSNTYSCPYEGLGLLYLKSGKLKEAEDNFKKAIAINPDIEYRKYNGLAEIFIKQGKDKEAKELLNKAIENYPENVKAKELLKEIEPRYKHDL